MPALLLLEGDGRLRDVAVLVVVGEHLQARTRLGAVDGSLALLVDHDTTEGVDGLRRVTGQTFVLGVLAREAVHAVLLRDVAHAPHLVEGLRRRLDEVAAVVEHRAVAGEGCGVELAVVGRGRDGRLQQLARVERERSLERHQPALGGELRRPDDVDRDDVVAHVLGLHVLHDVVVLLVGVVGLLLERDLLVGVGRVPLLDRGGPDTAVVLACHERDRAVRGRCRCRCARVRAVVTAAGGSERKRRDCRQCGECAARGAAMRHKIPPPCCSGQPEAGLPRR